ncbi:hypothetical protein [Nitrosomonas sp.]|uniref:hypothetical protein n=1 Tax=Nitrosomonas sp. TaxID=42353 RepID=UPI0025F92197|nr:hypothetical protein [Nitrosomonas sp.]MBV6448519.1 hypothetical protein [Nitrosomonas sp.]
MPVTDPGWLYDLCERALDVAASALPDNPDRQVVYPARPPDDISDQGCASQLAVWVEQAYPAGAGTQRTSRSSNRCHLLRAVRLRLRWVACFPSLDDQAAPPAVADINAATAALLETGWRIQNALADGYYGGSLLGAVADTVTALAAFTDMTPVGPSGGVAGVEIGMEITP